MCVCVLECLTGKSFTVCTPWRGSRGTAQFNNSQGCRVGMAHLKFSPAIGLYFFIRSCVVGCLSVCVSARCDFKADRRPLPRLRKNPKRRQRGTYTSCGLYFHACSHFHIKATWDQMSHCPCLLMRSFYINKLNK